MRTASGGVWPCGGVPLDARGNGFQVVLALRMTRRFFLHSSLSLSNCCHISFLLYISRCPCVTCFSILKLKAKLNLVQTRVQEFRLLTKRPNNCCLLDFVEVQQTSVYFWNFLRRDDTVGQHSLLVMDGVTSCFIITDVCKIKVWLLLAGIVSLMFYV